MQNLLSTACLPDPYPCYAELRREAPVHYWRERGVWVLSRYADVADALRRPDRFSSRAASFEPTLLGADPPAHTRVRRRVSGMFSTRRVERLADEIRTATEALLVPIERRGECDLIADLAGPLPRRVLAALLGLEPDHDADLRRWSEALLAGGAQSSADDQRRAAAAHGEARAFLTEHVERLRYRGARCPLAELLTPADGGDDLRGDPLREEEAVDVALLLLVAGTETTTNLIGNALVALLRHPRQHEAVRERPARIPALIEETLRYDAPVQYVQRTVTRAVEVGDRAAGGTVLEAGSRVMLLLGSANRDPDRFPEPARFSIDRNPRGHLAFGLGPHGCVGAELARLEARTVLQGLLTRLPPAVAREPLEEIGWGTHLQATRGPRRLRLLFVRD